MLANRLKKNSSIGILRHLSQLIIGIFIARELGVDSKGLHFVYTSIAAAIAILGSYGLVNSIVFHSKKGYINIKEMLFYMSLSMLFLLVSLFIFYLFGYSILKGMLFGSAQEQQIITKFFFLYSLSSLLNYFINSFCLAFDKTRLYLFNFAFSSVISLSVVAFGISRYQFDIVDCLIAISLIEVFFGMVSFIFICCFIKLRKNGKKKNLKDVIAYALKGYLGVSGSTVIAHGDTIILSNALEQESLGIYSIAKTLYRLIAIVPQTVNSTIFGVLCEVDIKEAFKIVKRVCLSIMTVFFISMIGAFIVLDELIVMIYGESFSSAFEPSLILMLAGTLMASTAAINPLLLTQNKPFWSSKVTVFSGIVGLLACYILTIYLGLNGAAFSVLISAAITGSMRLFYYKKIQSLNKAQLFYREI